MNDLTQYRQKLERLKGRRDDVQDQIRSKLEEVKKLQREIETSAKSIALVQQVAKETQQQLEFRLSELVSLLLDGIFPQPYEFRLKFVERRNKTECDMLFYRNGKRVNPMNASGGGPVDVAAVGLRPPVMIMKNKRRVLMMDEPLRFLSVNLHPYATEIIHQITQPPPDGLGIQIIMVTHAAGLAEKADRTFNVEIDNDESHYSMIH